MSHRAKSSNSSSSSSSTPPAPASLCAASCVKNTAMVTGKNHYGW
jgi:hypothetical protein